MHRDCNGNFRSMELPLGENVLEWEKKQLITAQKWLQLKWNKLKSKLGVMEWSMGISFYLFILDDFHLFIYF